MWKIEKTFFTFFHDSGLTKSQLLPLIDSQGQKLKLECNRSYGFGFQKWFSRNFQFHRRDPTLHLIFILESTLFPLFIIMFNISPTAKPSIEFCIFSPFAQDAWRDSTQTTPSPKYKNCFESGSWCWNLFKEKTKSRRLFGSDFINKDNSQPRSSKGKNLTLIGKSWKFHPKIFSKFQFPGH